MVDLPPEIWSRVIFELRRPLPPVGPVGDASVGWKDLHQQDLTVMMRVSKKLNHLTGPTLYSEIVVDNPSRLIAGIEKPPASDPANFSSADDAATANGKEHPHSSDASCQVASTAFIALSPLHKQALLQFVTAIHMVATWKADIFPTTSDKIDYSLASEVRVDGSAQVEAASSAQATAHQLFPKVERVTQMTWRIAKPNDESLQSGSLQHRSACLFTCDDTEQYMQSVRFRCQRPSYPSIMSTGALQPAGASVAKLGPKIEANYLHDYEFPDLYDASRFDQNPFVPGMPNMVSSSPDSYCKESPISSQTDDLDYLLYCLSAVSDWWQLQGLDNDRIVATRLILLSPRPTPRGHYDAADDLSNVMAKLRVMARDTWIDCPADSYPAKLLSQITFAWADNHPRCKACRSLYPSAQGDVTSQAGSVHE